MSAITFLLGLLIGILASVLKEPEFLEEIEKANNGNCHLKDTDGAKRLIQQHLVSNIRNFYKYLNSIKPYLIFIIGLAAIVITSYYFIQLINGNEVKDDDTAIFLAAFLFFAITLAIFLMSLYAFLFSQIIKKYY